MEQKERLGSQQGLSMDHSEYSADFEIRNESHGGQSYAVLVGHFGLWLELNSIIIL